MKAITPQEVEGKKVSTIPSAVIEAFNELILKDFDGTSATVGQKEVTRLIGKKGISSTKLFNNHWLDVEQLYRNAGWIVNYDKPAYNETYEATFTFSRKKAC